jgi:hypothetical protein
VLAPLRPRRAGAAAVRNYKTSARGSDRLKFRVLAWGLQAGLAGLSPHRIRIHQDRLSGQGIDSYLETALQRPVVVSPFIGPPRAIQKPVLQVLTPQGETLAFVKIGIDALTRSLVAGEAEALARLGERRWSHLVVPEVLHHGRWGGYEVLAQRALSSGAPTRNAPSLLADAMAELALMGRSERHRLSDSRYWLGLRSRVRDLERSPFALTLAAAMDDLSPRARSTMVGFGSWHGDWAPWNMIVASGRVKVWDWENYEEHVPLGFDAVHYQVQKAVVSDRVPVTEAFASARNRARDLLAPFGVTDEKAAELTVLLYGIEIATRYLEDGELDRGTRMGQLDNWLVAVLTRHTALLNNIRR